MLSVVICFVSVVIKERGERIQQKMLQLEKQKLTEMEEYLRRGVHDSTLLVHLFSNTVNDELSIYSNT